MNKASVSGIQIGYLLLIDLRGKSGLELISEMEDPADRRRHRLF